MNRNMQSEGVLCYVGSDRQTHLVPGSSVELCNGVRLTLISSSGESLLEVTGENKTVMVAGRNVIDVVQIQPREVFTVNGQSCFVLRPYEIQISKKSGAPDMVRPDAPVRKNIVQRRRMTMLLPTVSALLVMSGLGLRMHGQALSSDGFEWPEFPAYAQQPQEALEDSPFAETSDRSEDTQSDLDVTDVDLKDTPRRAGGGTKKPAASSPKSGAASKGMWREYQEYSLEAKFDPAGARQKLNALKERVPQNSRLRETILNDLRQL